MNQFIAKFLEKGWKLHPVYRNKKPCTKHGVRDASNDSEQIEKWLDEYPDCNWAVACGQASGIVVLDIDQDADEKYKELKALGLPESMIVRTGRGGLHIYLSCDEPTKTKPKGLAVDGVELQADGHYVVVPGSIHENGKTYKIVRGSLDTIATATSFLVSLINEKQKGKETSSGSITEGHRHNGVFEYGCKLSRLPGLNKEEIHTLLFQFNIRKCTPPLPEAEVEAIAQSIGKESEKVIHEGISGSDLLIMQFPEKVFIVPELIRLGTTTLLIGGPKLGKSWLVQQMAIGIARGGLLYGKYNVEKRHVLYLANEDNEESLHDRLGKLTEKSLSRLQIKFRWTRGEQGIADMRTYLEKNPETQLVIIDCLATVTSEKKGRDVYQADYDEIKRWWTLAKEKNISIIIVHHTRKMLAHANVDECDVMEMVNGSTGYAGAADQIMVLVRKRKSPDAKLYSMGRAVRDQFLALHWDDVEGGDGWSIVGDMDKVQLSVERMKVLAVLETDGGPMTPTKIAKLMSPECSPSNVSQILVHLVEDGYIKKISHGTYQVCS